MCTLAEETVQTVESCGVQVALACCPSNFVCPVCGTKYRGNGFVIEAVPAEDGGFEDSEPELAHCVAPATRGKNGDVPTLFCSRSPFPTSPRNSVRTNPETRKIDKFELSDVDDIYSERRARIVKRIQ